MFDSSTLRTSLVVLTTVAALSCDRSPAPKKLPVGQPLFSFELQEVTEVSLRLEDPTQNFRLSARLTPAPPQFQTYRPKHHDWWIETVEGTAVASPPLDRLANSNWVYHLLDTLRTLKPDRVVTDEDARLGLAQPRAILKWKVQSKGRAQEGATLREYEIWLGSPIAESPSAGVLNTYGRVPTYEERFETAGSALRMLGFLTDYKKLRYEKILPITEDEVEEIHFRKPKASFYRNGTEWMSRPQGPNLPTEEQNRIAQALEKVLHQRISNFLDDPDEQKVCQSLPENSKFHSEFHLRTGEVIHLRFDRVLDLSKNPRLFVRVTRREPTCFEVYPGALDWMTLSKPASVPEKLQL